MVESSTSVYLAKGSSMLLRMLILMAAILFPLHAWSQAHVGKISELDYLGMVSLEHALSHEPCRMQAEIPKLDDLAPPLSERPKYDPNNGTVSVGEIGLGSYFQPGYMGHQTAPAGTSSATGELASDFADLARREEYRAILFPILKRHTEFKVAHYESVFKTQLLHSKIIFWLVLFLVVVGVSLSYLQLRNSWDPKPRRKTIRSDPKDDIPPNSPQQQQNLEIEMPLLRLKLSSSVLGVVILALSLGFFFLYLELVYPINVIP